MTSCNQALHIRKAQVAESLLTPILQQAGILPGIATVLSVSGAAVFQLAVLVLQSCTTLSCSPLSAIHMWSPRGTSEVTADVRRFTVSTIENIHRVFLSELGYSQRKRTEVRVRSS